MGRSLIATEPCQICGDRSFGRHYGLWTCDGCSCFFKRSIRRNIRYTCISGENNCPVDKTRRNWCPACRLRKCLDMEMNVNAVQKERGPRRKKADLTENENPSVKLMLPEKNLKEESSNASKSPKSSPINEATNKVNPTQLVTMPWTMGTEFAIDTTLIAALTNASKSSVIVFQSPEVKSIIMTKLWPLLYALYATQTSTLYASLAFDGGEGGITKTIQTHFNAGDNDLVPDGEEVRLLTCLLFCLQGAGSTTELAYAASLSDTYRFWLARHCTNFYGNDTTRFGKLIEFVEAISRIDLDGLTLFRLNFKLDPMTIIACLTAGAAKVQI